MKNKDPFLDTPIFTKREMGRKILEKEEAFNNFKTEVLVKLEMLRGCCQVQSIKKSQIAESIKEFIKKVEKY
jgi:hypothetical protein